MLGRICAGAVVVLAISGLASVTGAQEPTVNSVQKQEFPAQPQREGRTHVPDGTVPPPPHAQPKAPLSDLAKPAAVGPAQANTADRIHGDKPPGATPQTTPSTMSEDNAALDKMPIGALQLPLNEEKRRLIADTMVGVPDTTGTSGFSDLDVTSFVPSDVTLESFPPDLVRRFPETSRYKYLKRDGVVFIVDPPNLTVVGEVRL